MYEMNMNIMGWRWVILEEQGKSADENYIRERHIYEKLRQLEEPELYFREDNSISFYFSIHPHICVVTDKRFELFIC